MIVSPAAKAPPGTTGVPGSRPDGRINGLPVPEAGAPLAKILEEARWAYETFTADDVNAPEIARKVASLSPRLTVYSGFGGQLVGEALLRAASPLLHVHSGYLPRYRGSTTIYYSMLAEGFCGATALLLDRGIDTGPVIARRRYPLPPRGFDIDHLYDGMIRADLLTRVLKSWAKKGSFPRVRNQDADEGETFYVIHPVLKHLALLSLK